MIEFEKNIIGNEKIKKYLIKQVENGTILHSYLFSGIDGIGKKEFAKEFAKLLLCKNSNECELFKNNNHPDYKIINEDSEVIKIEQIRDLINKIIEKPINSQKKVYIINDCHKMTVEAQNCLLKTLEEPPEFAILILITSNENLLLNTIISRCMKINFNCISSEEIINYCNKNLNIKNLSNSRIKSFGGSIGKARKFAENENEYIQIEQIINNLEKLDLIDTINNSKILYNKEKVLEFLDYMITYFFIKNSKSEKFLNCIRLTSECIKKIKNNGNLDMNIDMLLINCWEEINENSNWN